MISRFAPPPSKPCKKSWAKRSISTSPPISTQGAQQSTPFAAAPIEYQDRRKNAEAQRRRDAENTKCYFCLLCASAPLRLISLQNTGKLTLSPPFSAD